MPSSFTSEEQSALTRRLYELSRTQLVIRSVIWKPRLESTTECFRLEILFSIQAPAEVLWMEWNCEANTPERSTLFVGRKFCFGYPSLIRPASPQDAVHDVVSHWVNNNTGDGPRPHDEWLLPKPFASVLSIGARSSQVTTEGLKADSRPLLGYYGLFIGALDAYIAVARTQEEYEATRGDHRLMLVSLRTRFAHFFETVQRQQVQRVMG